MLFVGRQFEGSIMGQKRFGNGFSMKRLVGDPITEGVEYGLIDTEQHNKECNTLFHVSDTRGGGDYTVGSVHRLESSWEILRVN